MSLDGGGLVRRLRTLEFVPVEFDEMLDDDYDLRGWCREGEPTVETLERLDLAGVRRVILDSDAFR